MKILTRKFIGAVALTMLSSITLSDDIEIYTGVSAEETTDGAPNILFIMDTSGSMGVVEATPANSGDYDPNVDYGNDGNHPDDNYIYVYDTRLNYQNQFFTQQQNSCDSLTQFHSSNRGFPLYNDRGLQWFDRNVEIEEEDCTTNQTSQNSSGSDGIDGRGWVQLANVNIQGGLPFQLSMRSDRRMYTFVRYYRFGRSFQINSCSQYINRNRTMNCEFTPPNGADRMEVWYYNRDRRVSSTEYNLDYNISETNSCSTTTTSQRITQWNKNFEHDDSPGSRLECSQDAGSHGINNDSSATYPAYCPNGQICNQANYTTSRVQAVNWSTDNIPFRYFVDGNFHDYITNFGATNIPTTVGDAETFCTDDTRDQQFVDVTTGIVMECITRIDIMKGAVETLVDGLGNVNIGLMRFNFNEGGTIVKGIEKIESNRADFITELRALSPRGWTPLSETLYEAYLYFSGQSKDRGASDTDTGILTNGGSQYVSPITNSCQSNNIVFLSDGQPTEDLSAARQIQAASGQSCSDSIDGDCLDELSGHMFTNDVINSIAGANNINTYTIGLSNDIEILERAAETGGGQYFTAGDSLQLQTAFQQILVSILTESSTFVAPAVSVNSFNELQHRNELYYATFKPDSSPRWNGNIKKYRISNGKLVDANNNQAVDEATGFFLDSAQSFWSDTTDGATVTSGGFAGEIDTNRPLYTNINGAIVRLDAGNMPDEWRALVGAQNDEEALQIYRWVLGFDEYDNDGDNSTLDANHFVGDTLHSRPFVVTYSGTNIDNSEEILFTSTNQGLLHAINPVNGNERWSYIPPQLLPNIRAYALNDRSNQEHVYGLDGEITLDIEQTRSLDSTEVKLDKVELYSGQRRGGRRIFKWDVTRGIETSNPITSPWTISGGDTAGYEDLGQTWSKVRVEQLNGQKVLVFSGGYDEYYDQSSANMISAENNGNISVQGNGIYIADAETGDLIWSAGGDNNYELKIAGMHNSIPATPNVLDVNQDGNLDIIYAIDIAGRVFRFDFLDTEGQPHDDLAKVTGGMIADLSSDEGFKKRRFYNQIDISESDRINGIAHNNLVIGSGYRAHPKDLQVHGEAENLIFVVNDYYISRPKADENGNANYDYKVLDAAANEFTTISFNDNHLFKVTAGNPAQREINAPNGFYVHMSNGDGEKVLQSSITINHIAFVSAFSPTASSSNLGGCANVGAGSSRVYVIDLRNGEILDVIDVAAQGISAEIVILFTDSGIAVCLGAECGQAGDSQNNNGRLINAGSQIADRLGDIMGNAITESWYEHINDPWPEQEQDQNNGGTGGG